MKTVAAHTPYVLEKDYLAWAKTTFKADFANHDERSRYELNVSNALSTVEQHAFWQGLVARLEEASKEYRQAHGVDLCGFTPQPVALLKKPYDSVVNKTYRHNVTWNRNWPGAPKKVGWLTPTTVYRELDDLLRCTIVCSFIDGPGKLAESLSAQAKASGLASIVRPVALDEGYYAQHLYLTFPLDVSIESKVARVPLRVELQLVTQPQQLVRHLTHKYYKEQRSLPYTERESWKWAFSTNQFRARYLSHALHLLEALILDVRDSSKPNA